MNIRRIVDLGLWTGHLGLTLVLAGCSTPDEETLAREKYEAAAPLFDAGDYAAAAPLYEYVVWKRPKIKDAHIRLAVCYEKIGRDTEAISVLEKMVKLLDPDDAIALRNLARLYVHRGYVAEAVSTYRRILGRNPRDAEQILQEIARLGKVGGKR